MTEYRERFESLSAPQIEASDDMLMGAFRNGLKEHVWAELRIMKFSSLKEMMDLAHNVEERNMVIEKNRENYLSKHLKTVVATKWNVAKSNGGWTRTLGGSDLTRTTSFNSSSTKKSETKALAGEKHSMTSSVASNSIKSSEAHVRKLTDAEIAMKR